MLRGHWGIAASGWRQAATLLGDRRVDVLELIDFARLYGTPVAWLIEPAEEERAAPA